MTIRTLGAAAAVMLLGILAPPVCWAGEAASEGQPVAHWDFDRTLADHAGRSEDTLAARSGQARFVTARDVPGTGGAAVALGVLPADAQLLVAPLSPDLQLSPPYTIEAWIHPTEVGGWNRLILRWGGAPDYAYHLALHDGRASLCHNQANGQTVFFGNLHPGGVFIDAKPIPETGDVVLILSPGHGRNEHAGFVATLSVKTGPDTPSAMRTLSRSSDFRDPYPVSRDGFLAARGNQIVLLDRQGRSQVVYSADQMVHEPVPLLRQPRPEPAPNRTDPARPTATLVLADAYSGRNTAGVRRCGAGR